VYCTFGGVYAAQGKIDAARDAFRRAVDIHSRIGARLEWGKTSLAAGQCPVLEERERLGYLFEAERLFAEIGVQYWIDQTRSTLQGILSERSARGAPRVKDPDESVEAPVIVTRNAEMLSTLRMAERYAQGDLAILITGETGTGKDLLARYIRWMSPRRHQPFVTIDLSTIPESLWESELFGHRKGTFTGAAGEKAGLLESADGGTVFLNEIGNLPPSLQATLLEFLDSHQVRRLGDARPKTLDVRLIAATNSDLRKDVESGAFRSDLYYRLEEAPLHLAPLRYRRDDIPLLLDRFLREAEASATVRANLAGQRWVRSACEIWWGGNIRELRHFTQQVVSLAGRQSSLREFTEWAERLIDFRRRTESDGNGNGNRNGNGDKETAIERTQLLDALTRHNWNQRAVARELQMSESGVRHMMRRYSIERPVDDPTR
jgi:transcriptional regulator with GAF, ATPase, and Fis domain